MHAYRSPQNPLIKPADIRPSSSDFEVIGVFNAGVARLGDEVVLLLRVAERPLSGHPDVVLAALYDIEQKRLVTRDFARGAAENDFSDPRLIVTPGGTYLTSISHFKLARSKDGIHFEIDPQPVFGPQTDYEIFGVEDARISAIDGLYYVQYVAVSPLGITTALASTEDFTSFQRHGVVFCPDNKDVAIFPERVGGRFYALHRPASGLFTKQDIWIADSPDLRCWGHHRCLMATRPGCWDHRKIGAGAVPVRTSEGWLEIYHGCDANNRYCLGAVLLDAGEPWKVLARSAEPVLEPEADYECKGFFGNVVFTCGLLFEQQRLKIYYGAADTSVCYAELGIDEVFNGLR